LVLVGKAQIRGRASETERPRRIMDKKKKESQREVFRKGSFRNKKGVKRENTQFLVGGGSGP